MSASFFPNPDDLGPLGPADTVLCRVCDAEIDAATGDPVEEVTQDNVAAVQQYLHSSGQNEEGGVALITGE